MPAGAVFLAPQKGNGGGAVKRKNAFSPGSQAFRALQPSGTQVVTVLLTQGNPLRNHGRGAHQTSTPPTPCCTAHSSGKDRIDQLLFPRSPLRSALPGHSRPVTGNRIPQKTARDGAFLGKETDCHVAPLLGMTENPCHCEEAPGRRGNPPPPSPAGPKAPLCKGSCRPQGD